MRDKPLPDPNGRPQPVDGGFCFLEFLTTVAAVMVALVLMLVGYPVRMAGATRSTRLKMQEHQRAAAEAVQAASAEAHGRRR